MFLHNLTVIPPLTRTLSLSVSLCHPRIRSNYRFAVSTASLSFVFFIIVYFRTRIEISLALPKIFHRENRIPMISNLSFSNTSCDRIVTVIYRWIEKLAWPGMAAPRRVASNSFQLAAGKGRRERRKVASKKYAESCASAIPIARCVEREKLSYR